MTQRRMKMKVQFDDQVIQADNAIGIILSMQKHSPFDQGKTLPEFMAKMAVQSKTASGHDIRTDNPEAFVDDLIEAKLLKRV